ncbi:hypothetical protein [Streptomyces vilmorinianum]|uniref:hypothetical protein n=1 Tax=Streptomyces vilmorinianum TaxID=3051092 RepID=UPI0010FB1F9D|nr:hypothetical protein [Streptomyces vilmorinianum]
MRLRALTTAAACGLALLFAAAPSASAADGEFTYVYDDPSGAPHLGVLADPPSGVCLALPEVAPEWTTPAHSPRNHTDSTATVFTGPDCEGDWFSLRPFGGHASERLKLRSVVFS